MRGHSAHLMQCKTSTQSRMFVVGVTPALHWTVHIACQAHVPCYCTWCTMPCYSRRFTSTLTPCVGAMVRLVCTASGSWPGVSLSVNRWYRRMSAICRKHVTRDGSLATHETCPTVPQQQQACIRYVATAWQAHLSICLGKLHTHAGSPALRHHSSSEM